MFFRRLSIHSYLIMTVALNVLYVKLADAGENRRATWETAWEAFYKACKEGDRKAFENVVANSAGPAKGGDLREMGAMLDSVKISRAVPTQDGQRVTLYFAALGGDEELGENNAIRLVNTAKGWKVDLGEPSDVQLETVAAHLDFIRQAQFMYARMNGDGSGNFFALGLRGDHSLFESKAGQGDLRLVSAEVAWADDGQPGGKPFHGYRFRILTAQGQQAEGGALDYKDAKGRLAKGFAILAYPEPYQAGRVCIIANGYAGPVDNKSGAISFSTQERRVYVADFGEKTVERLKGLRIFNPDPKEGWRPKQSTRK